MSASGRGRNFYPQRGKFVNRRSTINTRSTPGRIVSNRSQIARAKRFGTKQNPPSARGTAAPRSVSRPFISRKSTTPFAGFWNRKPKGEKPYTQGDLAGKPLRTKNFQSQKPVLQNPTARPYRVKHARGDRPYKGPRLGGFVSKAPSGKPWKGDIAGRKIKGRNYESKRPPIGGKRILPPPRSVSGRQGNISGAFGRGGSRSISGKMKRGGGGSAGGSLGSGGWNNNGRAIAGRNAGANARLGKFSGNMKSRKGYSVQGESYTGSIKVRRPLAGGGSISGPWNNKGRAIAGRNAGANARIGSFSGNMRPRKGYSNQGENYTGNIKARRPLTGGGSISAAWNNKGRAIAGRYPGGNARVSMFSGNMKPRSGYSPQGETYTGNIKARRPLTGGGSISAAWNNKGRAIAGRYPGGNARVSMFSGNMKPRSGYSPQGETYSGSIKTRKPLKGGGSVSGKFWNNREEPTTAPNPNSIKLAKYQGNIRRKDHKNAVDYFPGKYRQFDLRPSMRNQGEEFTGHIKLSRLKRNYLKSPHQSGDALKKDRPDKTTYLVNGLQIKVKQKDYKKRPHGADGSMPGIAPGKNSIRASEYARGARQYSYKRNPSSAEAALRVREPGKAFLRATDYQGNIKIKRFDIFKKDNRYPDARFVKTNKNNTAEERDVITNFKLWWARLFKKNETQPHNLKDKEKKPRYDKGEKGLWYD